MRISSDPTGARLGVSRQLADCRTKAGTLDWHVVAVYEDNDISASTGKTRPAYERMLQDLRHGAVNAVVVWDLDRLTRRPIEVEQFIDLADRNHISLASVGGDIDLATDNGRMFARIKGAVARAEIERKSARQLAANKQRAEAGRPHAGRRVFGYTRDGMSIEQQEGGEVRRAVDRLLAGHSLRSICADLDAREVRTTAGNPWKPTELRRLLANPRHAGLRVHQGAVIGPAVWPAIIDEDTHAAVLALLSDPARKPTGRPRRHLLSGLATCAACGQPCYGVTRAHGPTYFCPSQSHLSRLADPVDQLVTAATLTRLSEPDAAALFTSPSAGDKVAVLTAHKAVLRARLSSLGEAFAIGDIDRDQLRVGTEKLRTNMEHLTAQITAFTSHPALTGLIEARRIQTAWKHLPRDTQRAVIDTLMRVSIHPPGRGARHFNPRTVTITWR